MCTEHYDTILENGIGKYASRTKRHVAIVGAGMAGLVAAWLPRRAGLAVTIYEASHKVGGRVRTLRDGFSSGLYAEAGAMRIPERHLLTLSLCKRFDLELATFVEYCPANLMYINGISVLRSDYDSGKCHFNDPYTKGRTAAANHGLNTCLSSFRAHLENKPSPSKNRASYLSWWLGMKDSAFATLAAPRLQLEAGIGRIVICYRQIIAACLLKG